MMRQLAPSQLYDCVAESTFSLAALRSDTRALYLNHEIPDERPSCHNHGQTHTSVVFICSRFSTPRAPPSFCLQFPPFMYNSQALPLTDIDLEITRKNEEIVVKGPVVLRVGKFKVKIKQHCWEDLVHLHERYTLADTSAWTAAELHSTSVSNLSWWRWLR